MIAWLDNLFPWFGDMHALGGEVLLLILAIALVMWALIFERLMFLWLEFPRQSVAAMRYWHQRADHKSWYAQQFKARLLLHLRRNLQRNLSLIRTLIKVCPLLGLLGTVVGMLEVFDSMAATGNNSARSTAAGVSKATVTTMAGMVVAISGLLISIFIERRALHGERLAAQAITSDERGESQRQQPPRVLNASAASLSSNTMADETTTDKTTTDKTTADKTTADKIIADETAAYDTTTDETTTDETTSSETTANDKGSGGKKPAHSIRHSVT